jgi:dTDP-4-dehydrorhamnose reductase
VKPNKIAIMGARGLLGRDLCRVFGRNHDLLPWDLDEIDITDRLGAISALERERPDLIINAAAFVDLERCELEADTAWKVNAFGVYNVTSLDACTRFEFTQFVMAEAGRNEPVEAVDSKSIQRTTPRPPRSVLDCRLFQLVTGHRLPHWQQGVRDYLANHEEFAQQA